MQTYKVTAYRMNFGFTPALKQSSDVVFQTSIPFDNDHLEVFEDFMWDQIWIQNPHFSDPRGPIEGKSGWSSVLIDSKIEKI